jgi:hypothetical protein
MPDSNQKWVTALRIVAGLPALYFTTMVLSILYGAFIGGGVAPLHIIYGCAFGCAAIICWSFVLCGHIPPMRQRLRYASVWAITLGGITFILGFFIGPAIARSPQAPLFGFILAPIGFSLGGLIGAVHARFFLRLSSGTP